MSPVALLAAVAVVQSPSETAPVKKLKSEALPLRSVFTCIWPRKVLRSPKWEGSSEGLEKNWMMKVLFYREVDE